MTPPWKKWKVDVWFGPRVLDDSHPAADHPVQPIVIEQQQRKKPVKQQKPPAAKRKVSQDIEQDYDQADEIIKPKCKDYLLYDKRIRTLYVVIICIAIGVIFPTLVSYFLGDYRADLGNCETPARYRFECLSGSNTMNVTEETCQSAGCCWDASSTPKCFHSNPNRYTHSAVSVRREPHAIQVDLKPEWRDRDPFGRPLSENVQCTIRAVDQHHLIIQIKEKGIEDDVHLQNWVDQQTPFSETDFEVRVETSYRRSFGITIKRASTGTMLFDSTYGPIVISADYVEMTTGVPDSAAVFGLGNGGERRTSFARSFASYSKLALHQRQGAEGFHPMFMAADSPSDGHFYGVYWDNAHPLEVQLSPAPAVTFRSMGGSAVIHLLSGPRPADVSFQLMRNVLGTFAMPPFWSLGLHLCRETDNASVFWNTLHQMDEYSVPFDSDCIDLRLSGPGAGRVDTQKFPDALEKRETLRDKRKKFIIAQPPHTMQLTNATWITYGENETDALQVKRFDSIVYLPSYPDAGQVFDWDAVYQPEGIHLVDNRPLDESRPPSKRCAPYTGVFVPEKLKSTFDNDSNVCSSAYHPNHGVHHLAVHSQYGVQHLESWLWQTYGYPRMFYSNRASAWGNLGFAAHPGEDLSANWLSMQTALVEVLEMGIYGVTQAGAPICGSTNATLVDSVATINHEQLCTRWYQMGLLLPYAHSMSKLKHSLRSPVDWSLNFRRIVAGYIRQRYSLLAYYYTLFFDAKENGTPVVRPVWYQFNKDRNTYNVSDQFMIGDAIMVCPAMTQTDDENSVVISAYFPNGTWYDYHTGEMLVSDSKGERHNLVTGVSHINMLLLNGTVIVTQEPGMSAEDTRRHPYTVTVAAPFKKAQGHLYVDDGMNPDEAAYDLVNFTFNQTFFTMELAQNKFTPTPDISTVVDRVQILGLELKGEQVPENANYNSVTKVLQFDNLSFDWTQADKYDLKYII